MQQKCCESHKTRKNGMRRRAKHQRNEKYDMGDNLPAGSCAFIEGETCRVSFDGPRAFQRPSADPFISHEQSLHIRNSRARKTSISFPMPRISGDAGDCWRVLRLRKTSRSEDYCSLETIEEKRNPRMKHQTRRVFCERWEGFADTSVTVVG
jgi:hypothetical protein